jgi:hypothetical protein
MYVKRELSLQRRDAPYRSRRRFRFAHNPSGKTRAVMLAVTTVSIVAIAVVAVVAIIALMYFLPRGGRKRSPKL